ncbi:MAG: hypothetical protein Q7T38_00090 [Gallionella sp.]|nr:hypothetical protein [Gallionella sp.]
MRLLNLLGLTILLAFTLAGCDKKPVLPLTSASAVSATAPAVLV